MLTPDGPLIGGNDADLFTDTDGQDYLFRAGVVCVQVDLEHGKVIGKPWGCFGGEGAPGRLGRGGRYRARGAGGHQDRRDVLLFLLLVGARLRGRLRHGQGPARPLDQEPDKPDLRRAERGHVQTATTRPIPRPPTYRLPRWATASPSSGRTENGGSARTSARNKSRPKPPVTVVGSSPATIRSSLRTARSSA